MRTIFILATMLMVTGCISLQGDIQSNSADSFVKFAQKYQNELIIENMSLKAEEKPAILEMIKDKQASLFVDLVGSKLNTIILCNDELNVNQKRIIYMYYLQASGHTDKQIFTKLEEFDLINEINGVK